MNRFPGLANEETKVTRALRARRLPGDRVLAAQRREDEVALEMQRLPSREKEEQKKSRVMLRRVTGLAHNRQEEEAKRDFSALTSIRALFAL